MSSYPTCRGRPSTRAAFTRPPIIRHPSHTTLLCGRLKVILSGFHSSIYCTFNILNSRCDKVMLSDAQKKSIWSYFILLLVVITGTSVVSGGAIILPTLFQCHSLQTLAFLIEWNVTSHPALLSLLGSFEMNRKRASHHYFVLAKKKGGVAS